MARGFRFGLAIPADLSADPIALAREADERGEPLEVATDFEQEHATFPFGTHVAVVEVDTETGLVRPVRHVAVDDAGRVVNPLRLLHRLLWLILGELARSESGITEILINKIFSGTHVTHWNKAILLY